VLIIAHNTGAPSQAAPGLEWPVVAPLIMFNMLDFTRAAADRLSPPCINFIFGAFNANKRNSD
jgi:hypothetical protein